MEMLADLWTASWRLAPAAAGILAGSALALRGVWRERHGLSRPPTDPVMGAALARALRSTIVGLAVAGMAAAWWAQAPVWFVLFLCIGAEELWEISVVLEALDDADRRASWDFGGRFARNATPPAKL